MLASSSVLASCGGGGGATASPNDAQPDFAVDADAAFEAEAEAATEAATDVAIDVAPLPPGTLAQGFMGLVGITLDADWVYFTAHIDGDVARVRKTGGPVEYLARRQPKPKGLALAGSTLWTADEASLGALRSIDLSGDAGVTFNHDGLVNGQWVAADGTHVVIAHGSGIRAYTGTTSHADLDIGSKQMFWGNIAIDGNDVYFSGQTTLDADAGPSLADAGIDGEPVDGGIFVNAFGVVRGFLSGNTTAKYLAPDLQDPAGIAVDSTYVYVAARAEGRVVRVKKDGTGSVETVVGGLNAPNALALDADTLFLSERAGGRILAVKLADKSVKTIKSGLVSPEGVAVDGTNVYWVSLGDGAVMFAPR